MGTFYRVIYSDLLDRYLLLISDKGGLKLLIKRSPEEIPSDLPTLGRSKLYEVVRDLKTYLRGQNVDFSECMVNMETLTLFEKRVMEEVREIPYGSVRTYGEVAGSIGNKSAYRAVGRALGKNPAPIIVPCHRVVAKAGIGGYAFGINMKEKLISLEKGSD
ncbi:MAG: Methylated-DNA--protein-cysteine methyltransferase [Candidatus Syntrophoarchaeum sp. GoM_oil]|nr:MAG: Methylated-DNA--protein-cysteine methyltransferase [Candidatus Syntrophoarchaeum sp. GoM_oil]